VSTYPIRRRIFRERLSPAVVFERWLTPLMRWALLIGIAGALAIICVQVGLARRGKPACERYDARHDVGITQEGGLCRRR
jgi:hypothetical protein